MDAGFGVRTSSALEDAVGWYTMGGVAAVAPKPETASLCLGLGEESESDAFPASAGEAERN